MNAFEKSLSEPIAIAHKFPNESWSNEAKVIAGKIRTDAKHKFETKLDKKVFNGRLLALRCMRSSFISTKIRQITR